MHVDPIIQEAAARSVAALCYLGTITYGLFLVRKIGSTVGSFWTWRHDVATRKLLRDTNQLDLMVKLGQEKAREEDRTQRLKDQLHRFKMAEAIDLKRAEATTMAEAIKAVLGPTLHVPLETSRYAYRLRVVANTSCAHKQNNDDQLEIGDIIEGAVMTPDKVNYIYPRKGGACNQIRTTDVTVV